MRARGQGLYLALLPPMRFVPSHRVRTVPATLILCAIVAFGLDSSLSASVVTNSDRIVGASPDVRDGPNPGAPNPGARDNPNNPIHVPEPATLILMGIGLGGVAARRVRSNRATHA
jgi:PEP-CTERM motif-containing protein